MPKYPLRVFVLENEDLNSTGFSRTMGQLSTLEWQHVATPVSAPPPELKAETRLRKDTMLPVTKAHFPVKKKISVHQLKTRHVIFKIV